MHFSSAPFIFLLKKFSDFLLFSSKSWQKLKLFIPSSLLFRKQRIQITCKFLLGVSGRKKNWKVKYSNWKLRKKLKIKCYRSIKKQKIEKWNTVRKQTQFFLIKSDLTFNNRFLFYRTRKCRDNKKKITFAKCQQCKILEVRMNEVF